MLFIKTIEPNTLSILKRLQSLPKLENFGLVGGTALALKHPLVTPMETLEAIRLSSTEDIAEM